LRMTPPVYLKNGFLDQRGQPAAGISGVWATAAATRFEEAETPAQEVAGTFECMRQVLPWHERTEDPAVRITEAAEEALETAARLYEKDNDAALVRWLDECVARVRSARDIELFMKHFEAVALQYSLIAGLKAP